MREDKDWLLEEIGRRLRQAEEEQVRMVWWCIQGIKLAPGGEYRPEFFGGRGVCCKGHLFCAVGV